MKLEKGKCSLSETTADTNHGVVPDGDDDPRGRALHGVGGEEGEVLGLLRVVIGALGRPRLRLRLARQAATIASSWSLWSLSKVGWGCHHFAHHYYFS